MIRTTVRASQSDVCSSDLARTLLDGAAFYGAAHFDGGRYRFPLVAISSQDIVDIPFPDQKYVYAGVDRGDGINGILHASNISDAAGAGSDLVAGDLRDGVTVDNVEGTLELPAEADVKDGVQYGANGTEFEGTLETGGGEGEDAFQY